VVLGVPRALLESSRGLAAEPPPSDALTFARSAAHAEPDLMRIGALEPEADPRVDDLFTGGGDG
jgi:hypothetical protein